MGPDEGGKQQTDKHRLSPVCVYRYMCPQMLVKQLTDDNVDVLCVGKSAFSRVQH